MGGNGDLGETTPNESSTEAKFLHHRSLFYLLSPARVVKKMRRFGYGWTTDRVQTSQMDRTGWDMSFVDGALCTPVQSHLNNNNKPDSVDCDTILPGDGWKGFDRNAVLIERGSMIVVVMMKPKDVQSHHRRCSRFDRQVRSKTMNGQTLSIVRVEEICKWQAGCEREKKIVAQQMTAWRSTERDKT
jgi:hypothetical protein